MIYKEGFGGNLKSLEGGGLGELQSEGPGVKRVEMAERVIMDRMRWKLGSLWRMGCVRL